MWRNFRTLFQKDCRMLSSGKYFLMAAGFLLLYTLYVNLGYVRFMQMSMYHVYLYDPVGIYVDAGNVQRVPSKDALYAALKNDTDGMGLDAESAQVILYNSTESMDRYRADYALSVLQPDDVPAPKIVGHNTPEQKARREITCELLFFELSAVGFLGIASVLFKEKSMGVLRLHAVLPFPADLFLLSKLTVFLFSDLMFALLLTLFNVNFTDKSPDLPAILLQTAVLSLIMSLTGLLCSLLLKDFRQFTLAYLLIAVFAATPVFLSANTSVKFDWIRYHPFYHLYMGMKNAYFGTSACPPAYWIGAACSVAFLFISVRRVLHREMRKDG